MGILNVTPDSFSDGGSHNSLAAATARARSLVDAGADIIDIGGESTRPGATPVAEADELGRVIPIIEAVRAAVDVPISIDTYKPNVMRAAVSAGAGLINDVYGLSRPDSRETAAELGVPVCLMHMCGDPTTMQRNPQYDDVVEDVFQFLYERRRSCVSAGIRPERIIVDPGFGFGKTLRHNLLLLDALPRLRALAAPILVGLSRKGMVGQITGLGAADRDLASAALASRAVMRGASIVRVHDVRATRHVLRTLEAADSSFWHTHDADEIATLARARF